MGKRERETDDELLSASMARFGFPPSSLSSSSASNSSSSASSAVAGRSTSPRERHLSSKKMSVGFTHATNKVSGGDAGISGNTNGPGGNESATNTNANMMTMMSTPSKPQHPHSPRANDLQQRRLRRKLRARLFLKVFLVVAFLHFFGRTAYHFLYFVKIGYLRYIKFPLRDQRPIPCGNDTPPPTEQLADLFERRKAYEESRKSLGVKMKDAVVFGNKASGSPKHLQQQHAQIKKRHVKKNSRGSGGRNAYAKTSGRRRLFETEEVYGKREDEVEEAEAEEEEIAHDDSKRTGFGVERFEAESDSKEESGVSEDAYLELGEDNYPSEVLSKEQGEDDEDDDEERVGRKSGAPRRAGSNFASRFFGGLGQRSSSPATLDGDSISREVIEVASKRATQRIIEDPGSEPPAPLASNGEEGDFHLVEDEEESEGEEVVEQQDGEEESVDESAISEEEDAGEERKFASTSYASADASARDDTDEDFSYDDPKSQLEAAERKANLLEEVALEAKKRVDEVKEKTKRRGAGFAILCICDAHTADICAASVANKRAYAKIHEYDLIFVTETLDTTRPMAWSKILAVQRYLPRYKWLLFLDIDTLIMNPDIRLEDIADDNYDQVVGADHNGINSGVWFVKNTRWMRWFLTELWAQEDLVRGNYVFHYEQRAFHHLFQTEVWSNNVGTSKKPYEGAEDVRKRSKVVNQCVFNSLLPWYVNGDFVVHFAGMKGVAQCYLFWQYYEKAKNDLPPVGPHEIVGARLTEEMLEGGPRYEFKRCLSFPTLFW